MFFSPFSSVCRCYSKHEAKSKSGEKCCVIFNKLNFYFCLMEITELRFHFFIVLWFLFLPSKYIIRMTKVVSIAIKYPSPPKTKKRENKRSRFVWGKRKNQGKTKKLVWQNNFYDLKHMCDENGKNPSAPIRHPWNAISWNELGNK